MAKYDQGGGCPCGLEKVCDCIPIKPVANQYIDWKEDTRPRRHGWAPGDYIATCRDCKARMMSDKRATLCADCAYKDWKPTHRHGKTAGLYRLTDMIIVLEKTMENHVVYEGQDGTFWGRPYAEFHDGRFADITKE